MTDSKAPIRRSANLPSSLANIDRPGALPDGNAWFGPEHSVLDRRRRTVEASTAYLKARRDQSDAYTALLDARVRVIRKIGELADLHNLISEDQRQREHTRALAEQVRAADLLNASQDLRVAVLRHELEIAKLKEQCVRAHRNLEAAKRVADVQVDQWYQQAAAARNEAEATRQDADADLRHTPTPGSADALKAAAADEFARALATIDHEIELATQRNNAAAVMALQNIKARLKSAA